MKKARKIFFLFFAFMPLFLKGSKACAKGIFFPTRELTLYTGDIYSLEGRLDEGTPIGEIEYYLYNEAKMKRVKSSKCLNLDGINGTITALKPGSISVVVSYKVWNNQKGAFDEYQDKCQVTVLTEESEKGLNYTYINRAVGSKRIKLKVKNAKEGDVILWSSGNPRVAAVNKNGGVLAKRPGSTMITAVVQRKKKILTYFCEICVSQPLLDKNVVEVKKGETSKVSIMGVNDENAVQWVVNDSQVAAVSIDGTVLGKSEGSTIVKVKAEGILLKLIVYVENPDEGKADAVKPVRLVVGEETTIVPENLTAGTKVSWSSKRPDIASVDSNGRVKALSAGNTIITADVGGQSFVYHVSAGNNKKAVEAVEAGEALLGCRYSSERRMEEGYYDCSSYVFRVYAPLGYLFGCESPEVNAPSSSDLAKWCSENGCVISLEPVKDLDLLLPGDLIFYSYSKGNGRYLNIDHVAVYNGYGTIIHASDEETGVKQGKYWVDNYIVMVARPAG